MSPTARWICFLCAIALLAFAGVLQINAGNIAEELRSPTSHLPIDLHVGTTKIPEFMVASEGRYSVTLYLDRDPANREGDCLLGVPFDANKCAGISAAVSLSWSLFIDGVLSQQGESRPRGAGSWSGRRVGNTFAEFLGKPGQKYVLHIASLRDASALASAKPEITVSRSARESKGLFATASLYSLGAIATAVLAAILMLTWAVACFFSRRKATQLVGKYLPLL